jgi:hypothetical protein
MRQATLFPRLEAAMTRRRNTTTRRLHRLNGYILQAHRLCRDLRGRIPDESIVEAEGRIAAVRGDLRELLDRRESEMEGLK